MFLLNINMLLNAAPAVEMDYGQYLQRTDYTCGAAALRFALTFHGIQADEESVAIRARSDAQHGTTLLNLKRAAENFGVLAVGARWDWATLIEQSSPTIAHINDNHYVVVLNADATVLNMFDPQVGLVHMKKQQFLSIWKGIVLTLAPSASSDNTHETISSLPLGLKDAVKSALQNGAAVKQAAERVNQNRYQLDEVWSQYGLKEDLLLVSNKNSGNRDTGVSGVADTQNEQRNSHQQLRYEWSIDTLLPRQLGGSLMTRFALESTRNEDALADGEDRRYDSGPSLSLEYTQPLSADGREQHYSQITLAQNGLRRAQLLYKQDRQTIIFNTVKTYYELLRFENLISLNEENIRSTKRQLENARVQFRMGDIAGIEVSKTEVQLSRETSALVEVQKNRQAAEESLLNALGIEIIHTVIPTHRPSYKSVLVDRKKTIQLALEQRPEMHVLDIEQQDLNVELATARAQDDGTLTVTGRYQRNQQAEHFRDSFSKFSDKNWNIEARLSLPIYDGGVSWNRSRKSMSKQAALKAEKRITVERIRFEVNEALRSLESNRLRYQILEETEQLAKQNMKIDELRFNKGVISSDDLQRTQTELLQVKVDRYNALIDYDLSKIQLDKAIGILEMDTLE